MSTDIVPQTFLRGNPMVFTVGTMHLEKISSSDDEYRILCRFGLQAGDKNKSNPIKKDLEQLATCFQRATNSNVVPQITFIRHGRDVNIFLSDDDTEDGRGDLLDLWIEVRKFRAPGLTEWEPVTAISMDRTILIRVAPGWYRGAIIDKQHFRLVATTNQVPVYRFGYTRRSNPDQHLASSNWFIEKNDGRIKFRVKELINIMSDSLRIRKRSFESNEEADVVDEEAEEAAEKSQAKRAKNLLNNLGTSSSSINWYVNTPSNDSQSNATASIPDPFLFDEMKIGPQKERRNPLVGTYEEERELFGKNLDRITNSINKSVMPREK